MADPLSRRTREVFARAVRRTYRIVEATVPGPLVVPFTAHRIRDRVLLDMDVSAVLDVLDVMEVAGLRPWLIGGWGVDALLGRQTRRHRDLDLVLDPFEDGEQRARQALARRGYEPARDETPGGIWMPKLSVLRDSGGRTVDLVGVDWTLIEAALDDGLDRAHADDPSLPGPGGPLTVGMIGGRTVDCVSAPVQLLLHTQFEPRDIHRQDMARLCDSFGLSPVGRAPEPG
jgi:lincosamide nucleotidyltransferase A/C/D/E